MSMKQRYEAARPPKKPKQVTTNLRIDANLHARILKLKPKDISLNTFIVIAILEACDELDKAKAS